VPIRWIIFGRNLRKNRKGQKCKCVNNKECRIRYIGSRGCWFSGDKVGKWWPGFLHNR
jgi:hypothetical protein